MPEIPLQREARLPDEKNRFRQRVLAICLPRLSLAIFATLALALPGLAEKPRLATVDVSKAFEAYHLTVSERAKVKEARKKLHLDPRHEQIKLLKVEVKDLKREAKDLTLGENQRMDFYRRFMMKNYERSSLEREHKEHLEEQMKVINEGMVKKTYELLGDVRAVVQKIGEEQEFDHVFETSGKTSSQITPLLYIRNGTDITDLVIAELNKDQPKEEVAAAVTP